MIPVQTKDNCEVGIFDNKSQQMFSYLFKALLFIHFPLQQQITEAVLKIKVFFFCCLVKKKRKNLHKIRMTVQNEALICHINGVWGAGT